jgi:hypothetical protein
MLSVRAVEPGRARTQVQVPVGHVRIRCPARLPRGVRSKRREPCPLVQCGLGPGGHASGVLEVLPDIGVDGTHPHRRRTRRHQRAARAQHGRPEEVTSLMVYPPSDEAQRAIGAANKVERAFTALNRHDLPPLAATPRHPTSAPAGRTATARSPCRPLTIAAQVSYAYQPRPRIRPLSCKRNEPPWGVEPQTYALRVDLHVSTFAAGIDSRCWIQSFGRRASRTAHHFVDSFVDRRPREPGAAAGL